VQSRYQVFAWLGPLLFLNWLSLAFLDPDATWPDPLMMGYFMGSLFAHPTLAAAWGAFGPGGFAWRFPLSLLWAISLPIAIAINISFYQGFDREPILVVGGCLLGQWLALQFPFWALALGLGLHLRHSDELTGRSNVGPIHFGIRHLLIVMAIAGVGLGIGRVAVSSIDLSGDGEMFAFAFLAVAAIVVTLPLLLGALMRRFAALGVLLALLFMGLVTAVEWPLFNLVGGSGPSKSIFIVINIGMAAVILGCALIVRSNGYCLYGRLRGIDSLPMTVL
jgi:hypothetical protein